MGFTQGKLDKLERRVYKRMEKGVPFDLWDHEEQMYSAFYVTGQKCRCSAGSMERLPDIVKKES